MNANQTHVKTVQRVAMKLTSTPVNVRQIPATLYTTLVPTVRSVNVM